MAHDDAVLLAEQHPDPEKWVAMLLSESRTGKPEPYGPYLNEARWLLLARDGVRLMVVVER